MKPLPRPIVVGACVAALLAAGITADRLHTSQLAVARADAAHARAATVAAERSADSALRLVATTNAALHTTDSIRAVAVQRANSAALEVSRLRGALAVAAQAAPVSCAPVVALADSALAAQDTEIASLHVALHTDSATIRRLTAALDTTAAALGGLRGASANLVSADQTLAKRARPSLLARLLPHPGIGIAAGFTPAGTPAVLTGLTLSWSF